LPTINGKPIFAKSIGYNNVFALLVEKAWAKVHGSYERTESGLAF
jgi:hypothetical protein